jgi:serine phosphatase RsbU (regulator of sigma subunit)
LSPDQVYEQTRFEIPVGEAIVLLTDGVAEARNSEGALLGFAKVEAMLRSGVTAKDIAETAQRHGQNDDITVLRVARAG